MASPFGRVGKLLSIFGFMDELPTYATQGTLPGYGTGPAGTAPGASTYSWYQDQIAVARDREAKQRDYADMVEYDIISCFTGDTKVALPTGKDLSFIEIFSVYKEGEKFPVYSWDLKEDCIAIGTAYWSSKTRGKSKLVEVELDNGEKLRVTPDHKFYTKDLKEVRASDLQKGTSLLPLYRIVRNKDQKISDYETVFDGTNTHRLAANPKVVGVTELDYEEEVFCLVEETNHNFALSAGVFVHNSALDIYAEEAVSTDINYPDPMWIESDSSGIQKIGNDMLEQVKTIDNLYSQSWWVSAYGNNYEQVFFSENAGVVGIDFRDPNIMKRHWDEYKNLVGFEWEGKKPPDEHAIKDGEGKSSNLWLPWDFLHFRRLGRNRASEYGDAIIEDARQIFKKLKMAEDAMITHRLDMMPSRLRFKIDTGAADIVTQRRIVNEWRRMIRSQIYVDTAGGGTFEKRYNPWSLDNLIFFPVKKDSNTDVDKIKGDTEIPDIPDIKFLTNKLIAKLRIPPAYLGFEGDINCFSLEEEVPCLDGKKRTLGDIISDYEETGDVPWVYSLDEETNTIVPGQVIWAGITKKKTKCIEIELDDGSCHVCTPDHQWKLLEGSWVEAKDLEANMQLMPLNCKVTEGYTKTHQIVHAVREVTRRLDTGDITVKKHHNFFISDNNLGGVLVHNSKATLIQESVRFSRVIKALRKPLISGYMRLFEIHLAMLDIDPDTVDFQLLMPPINAIDEEMRTELLSTQLDIVDKLAGIGDEYGFERREWAHYVFKEYMKMPADVLDRLMLTIQDQLAAESKNKNPKKFDKTKINEAINGQMVEDRSLRIMVDKMRNILSGRVGFPLTVKRSEPLPNIKEKRDKINEEKGREEI